MTSLKTCVIVKMGLALKLGYILVTITSLKPVL